MKRSSQQSHRARVVMFEALQPRELMAVDAFSVADREGYRPYLPKVTAEQWADRILNNYEFSRSVQQDQSLADLKKFDSEQDAKKFLTDALLKTWQDVLGKPVNDKLNAGYIDYYLGPFFSTSGVLRSQNDDLPSVSNSTNNQVGSVDEADQFEVASNGYVYTLTDGGNGVRNSVKLVDARDPKNLVHVATINVQGQNAHMHLAGDQLILIAIDNSADSPKALTRVQVYKVSDPAKPTLQTDLTVSGNIQQSRFTDGKLTLFDNRSVSALRPLFISDDPSAAYLVLTDTPIGHFETAEEYTARIQPLVVGWMLPEISAEGSDIYTTTGDWKDLVADSDSNFHQQLTVLSFALASDGLNLIDSEAIIGATMWNSYVDSNTIYAAHPLTAWRAVNDVFEALPPTFEIVSIEFDSEKVEFVASGVIPGTIRDSRMMDEYQGNLRVFSNVRDISDVNHPRQTSDLYILKPDAGKLKIIGQLTDVADGQALYSAYFDEDQAMITTWVSEIPNQFTLFPFDPLHGFDLSDPTKPVELSELVIPGVSTYLQRVDATHLIGIGYVDVDTGDWRQQVSLYDVSDLANLKVVDTWASSSTLIVANFGGWNQNALALNFDPDSGLFSIASSAFGSAVNSALTVFKVDAGAKDPLQYMGQVGDEKALALRSTVVGDTLYLISNVWLQTYSIDNLSVELDRELLRHPAVDDMLRVNQYETGWINVLENDYSTGGRVTAISSSKVGGTVTILNNGTAIQYKASDHVESYGSWDELTYTVTLKNGTSYEGQLVVSVYPRWSLFGENNPIKDPSIYLPYFAPVAKSFAIDGDIDGNGELSPIDALLLLEHLNWQSERVVGGQQSPSLDATTSIMDLSGDGEISAIDLVMLINQLNANSEARQASGEGPGDSTAFAFVPKAQPADEALVSLLAVGYAHQDDILLHAKKPRS